MSTNVLRIIGAVAALVVMSTCGCCVCSNVLGGQMAADAAAAEARLIDSARVACAPPRVFRTRAGGRATRASDWECVGSEVVAAEAEATRASVARAAALDAARSACSPPSVFRTRAGADSSTAEGWECVTSEAIAAEVAATAEARARAQEEAAAAEEATAAAEAAASTHRLGDTFAMEGFSYQFTRFRVRRSVGGQFLSQRAPDGAAFVSVEFRERNDGNDVEGSLGSVVVRLNDGEGRVFRPDEEAMRRALLTGEEIEQTGDQLMPGVWHRRVVIFTVPDESTEGDVEVTLDARGAFTGGGVVRGRPR